MDKCFACGKKLKNRRYFAMSSDLAQLVVIGADCFEKVLSCDRRGETYYPNGPKYAGIQISRAGVR